MSSDLTRSTSTAPDMSLKNKIGLSLAGLLGLGDTLTLFPGGLQPGPGEAEPPFAVLVAGSVLGLITLVAVVYTWRSRSRVSGRIVTGSRILSMIIGLPAFFVAGVPSIFVVLTAVSVVVTVIAVGLVLSRPNGPHPIT
jgi:hypothetical protein